MPPQGCGMRRPAINGEQDFSPSDGRFLGSLVGAGTKVCGTIEYGPPTRCGPDVNRRLVSARVELPPEHAAILVEEPRFQRNPSARNCPCERLAAYSAKSCGPRRTPLNIARAISAKNPAMG